MSPPRRRGRQGRGASGFIRMVLSGGAADKGSDIPAALCSDGGGRVTGS